MGAGLRAHNVFKKKYPLIISDERVSLSHLNLMTLSLPAALFICIITPVIVEYMESRNMKSTAAIQQKGMGI